MLRVEDESHTDRLRRSVCAIRNRQSQLNKLLFIRSICQIAIRDTRLESKSACRDSWSDTIWQIADRLPEETDELESDANRKCCVSHWLSPTYYLAHLSAFIFLFVKIWLIIFFINSGPRTVEGQQANRFACGQSDCRLSNSGTSPEMLKSSSLA